MKHIKIIYFLILLNIFNLLLKPYNTFASDDCATATNINAVFTEECEKIGPFEQGNATVGSAEPSLPDCFNDGYDGTTWYSFVVPDDIAGGNPIDYIVSTGAYADCTNNPLNENSNTEIAIYDGAGGCPDINDISIACNDDFSSNPPFVSSVQVLLTPGNQYYIMVETFGDNLSGEFCFYVQPIPDLIGGGTKDCTNCGDNICNGVVGETFANCSNDCPCDASFDAVLIVNGLPGGRSLNYIAYCPEEVGGDASAGGVYIPFVISSSNIPMGPDQVTFLNSTLTSSVGSLFNYVISGSSPATPSPLGDANQNVTLLYLTPADISIAQSGTQIVLNFIDESGSCNIVEPVNVDLSVQCGDEQVFGCTDSNACNYNSQANTEDGSCEYDCNSANVWPGDKNNDGIVDQKDVSIIGFLYEEGPERAPQHQNIIWEGYPAQDWNDNLPFNGANIKHLDCNGDGIISSTDADAVIQNLGLTHEEGGQQVGNITFPNTNYQIYLQPVDDLDSDNLLEVNVVLESKNGSNLNLQGGYFTIDYNNANTNINSAAMLYTNSWLGSPGINMLGSYSNFPQYQQIEIGFSKTNGTNSNGKGIIGQITFQLGNNAARSANGLLDFEVKEIGVHNSQGTIQPIEEQFLQVGLSESNCQTNWTITEDSPFYNVYKSNGTIETDGFVLVGKEQEVEYKANRVRLEDGFSVRAGADFRAGYGNCN